MQAAVGQVAPEPIPLPTCHVHAERVEEPRPEIVHEALPGDQLHSRTCGVRRTVVVDEPATGFLFRLVVEERHDRIRPGRLWQRVPAMPGRHRQRPMKCQVSRPFAGALCLCREQCGQSVVQRQPALAHCQPDRGRGEALAQRVQQLNAVAVIRRPPALRDDSAVSQHHQAVRFEGLFLQPIDQGQEGSRRDALRLGGTTR